MCQNLTHVNYESYMFNRPQLGGKLARLSLALNFNLNSRNKFKRHIYLMS